MRTPSIIKHPIWSNVHASIEKVVGARQGEKLAQPPLQLIVPQILKMQASHFCWYSAMGNNALFVI